MFFALKPKCEEGPALLSAYTTSKGMGMRKLHDVVPTEPGYDDVKNTSAICSQCFDGGHFKTICDTSENT